jgi:hypothetical protein
MESKIQNALKNKVGRKLEESTINLYLKQLRQLNDNKPITNLKFLANPEEIDKKIEKYKPNTQRNKLIAIVSILKEMPNSKKLLDIYFDKLLKLNQNITQNDTGDKTETQKENWLDWKEVEEVKFNLKNEVDKFKSKKNLTSEGYNDILKYLILSLYTDIPPRRNKDYQHMIVVDKEPKELQKLNYLILKPKMTFLFNDYKSIRTHGKQEFDIPPQLQDTIKLYLKHKDKSSNIFLLDSNGNPFKNVNSLTYILNKIFGKKIGSSMLRHIYLSGKYQDVSKEQKDDSKKMAHTIGTQSMYIRN